MEDTKLETMLLEFEQAEDKQARVKKKTEICYHLHMKRQIDEARLHGEELLLLADEIGDKSCYCQILTLMAQGYLAQGKAESAKEYLDKALVIVEEIENPTLQGVIYCAYANLGFINGDYNQSLEWLLKAEKLFVLNDQTLRLPPIYENIANNCLMLKKYDLAMDYYHKSTDILKDSDERFRVFENIAMVYLHINDFKRADYYATKAFKYFKDTDKKHNIANCGCTLGLIKLNCKQYNNALKYAHEALTQALEIKIEMVQFKALVVIAQAYLETDELDVAKGYLEQALELESTCYDKVYLKRFYENYGILLSKLNNHELARMYNEKYKAVAKELES
jgi:tetratricopeptide (TPR) repeat protein